MGDRIGLLGLGGRLGLGLGRVRAFVMGLLG